MADCYAIALHVFGRFFFVSIFKYRLPLWMIYIISFLAFVSSIFRSVRDLSHTTKQTDSWPGSNRACQILPDLGTPPTQTFLRQVHPKGHLEKAVEIISRRLKLQDGLCSGGFMYNFTRQEIIPFQRFYVRLCIYNSDMQLRRRCL